MSLMTDLLMDARRRAMLSGMPLASSEEQGIVNSAAQGAGEKLVQDVGGLGDGGRCGGISDHQGAGGGFGQFRVELPFGVQS